MGLLSVLNLPRPKHWPAEATPEPAIAKPRLDVARQKAGAAPIHAKSPQQVEVIEEGGGTWDNREISEDEVDSIGNGSPPPKTPGAKDKPNGPDAAPAPGSGPQTPSSLAVPVSFSIPIKKGNKYVTIDSIKIEGELTLTTAGDAGVAQASDEVGVSVDKKKLVPAKKFEVDLGKLKELVLGDIEQRSQPSDWTLDSKLECEVSTEEVNVSISISVTNGWYKGSTKLVALAKSKGKEMQFANFSFSPISYPISKRPIELGGMKGTVSGKITVTLALTPNWKGIAADLAAKIGRPVLSTLASVGTAQLAIAAGFTAIAAAQIFAFVKSVSDIQDIKAWHDAADKGWESFRSGYCSVYGVNVPDGGSGDWRRAGVQAGDSDLKRRLENARKKYEENGGKWDAATEREVVAMTKADLNKNKLLLLVEKNHRRAVVKNFLDAYEQGHHDDWQFDTNLRALRARLGA